MATRAARGTGTPADPAAGRLRLGCAAVGAPPHRHGRMVAANAATVEEIAQRPVDGCRTVRAAGAAPWCRGAAAPWRPAAGPRGARRRGPGAHRSRGSGVHRSRALVAQRTRPRPGSPVVHRPGAPWRSAGSGRARFLPRAFQEGLADPVASRVGRSGDREMADDAPGAPRHAKKACMNVRAPDQRCQSAVRRVRSGLPSLLGIGVESAAG